jgi:hypothetical protein
MNSLAIIIASRIPKRFTLFKQLVSGIIFLISAGISSMIAAQSLTGVDIDTLGPQVGESVPEFTLPDQQGIQQTLESIMGPNGAMLLFHRSANW